MDEFLKLLETVLEVFEVRQSPQAFLVLIGLGFARILSFLIIVPFFGGAAVPGRIKVATATALVIIAYPGLAAGLPTDGSPLPFGPIGFAALIIKEALVGFTFGFVASLVFEAVQVAGRIIDAQRGSSMAEMFAPQLQQRVSELGQFKLQFAIVIFLAVGAHHAFLQTLIESFQIVPAMRFPAIAPGWTAQTESLVKLSAGVLAIGVQLAAPAIIALLLTDILFGIVNRVAPQVNVFFLSMPIKMFFGIFIVLLALNLYQSRYLYYFTQAHQSFVELVQTLGTLYR